jgi:hypothetical protein
MTRTRVTGLVIAIAVGAVALIVALTQGSGSKPGRASGPFAWLQPASPPSGWNVAFTPGGAALAYPPEWTPIKTDPGTASAALLARGGHIVAYLNATPRQGAETLADWRQFRPEHNGEEGDRSVRLLAATNDASFRSGRGSCVIDSYTTSKASYREIACLVSGARSSAVVVAAAPSDLFNRQAGTLERAVSSFVG